jgi:hypothetical protein
MANTELKVVIASEIGGLKDGLKNAVDSVQSAINDIKNSLKTGEDAAAGGIGNIISSFKSLGPAVATAAGAFMAFDVIKTSIDIFKSFGHEVASLSKVTGASAEEASRLAGTLRVLGVSTDDYISIIMKMERQLKSAPENFERLKIAVRDTNTGALLPTTQVMDNVIERMKQFKSGTDQIHFAMDVMGAKGATAAFSLMKMRDAAELAGSIMERLGFTMGEDTVGAIREMEMQMNAMKLVWTALAVKIGEELLPVMKKFVDFLISDGIPAIEKTISAFTTMVQSMKTAKDKLADYGITFKSVALSVASSLPILGAYVSALKTVTEGTDAANKVTLDLTGTETKKRKQKGTDTYTPPGPKGTKDKSRMAEWENELAEEKKIYEERGILEKTFQEFSKEQEKKFWQEKLKIADATKEERLSIERKIYQDEETLRKDAFNRYLTDIKTRMAESRKGSDERIALAEQDHAVMVTRYGAESVQAKAAAAEIRKIEREKFEETMKLREQMIESTKEFGLLDLKANEEKLTARFEEEKLALEREFDLFGNVQLRKTELERKHLEALKQFRNQEYAIEKEAMEAKLKLMKADPMMDPAAYAKQSDAIVSLTKKKDISIQKLNSDLTKTSIKQFDDLKQHFGKLFDPITQGFSTAIQGVIMGTQTLQQALANLAQSIVLMFIDMGVKMAMNWVATQIAAALATKAVKAEEATTVITANAAEAASGAASSQASIPYIGPALAVAAAAAMLATVLGFKSIASAEGGYDIPSGINPIVQTHGGEMILPANLAQGIRNMSDAGGSRGNFIFAPNINAIDSKSFVQTLKNSRSDLSRYFKSAMRDYRMG